MRPVALAVALVSFTLGTALAVEAPSGDGLGLRLLGAGESRHVVATLAPGEALRRSVEVVNGSDEAVEVGLYAAAATQGPKGFDFAEGRTPNQLSGWTSVRPAALKLSAGRSATAQVEVRVPEGAVEGDRYAVVWAEQVADGPAGVSLVSRVGVRLYISARAEAFPVLPVAAATALLLLAGVGWYALRRGRREP